MEVFSFLFFSFLFLFSFFFFFFFFFLLSMPMNLLYIKFALTSSKKINDGDLVDPLLASLASLSDQMLAAQTDENGAGVSEPMVLDGTVLLCELREQHLNVFLESRLKADAALTAEMKELAALEDELNAERELQALLAKRTASLLNFQFSDAAKKLLQQDEQSAAFDRTAFNALAAEREDRMALLRELERLMETRKELQLDISGLKSIVSAVPERLNEFAARIAQLEDTFGTVAPSRSLPVVDPGSLALPLRHVFLHLSAFVEANLSGVASITLRKKGALPVIELDMSKKKAGSGYCLLFGGEERVYVEVARGPNTTAWSNCLSLVNLFSGDEGVQCSTIGRFYNWLDEVSRGNASVVVQLMPLLEKRFVAQRYLSPQIDLLCQLQVHQQLSVNGTRLTTVSKLVSFSEQPQSQSLERVFVAKIECASASMTVQVRVSPEYPRVKPHFRFESSSAAAVTDPRWPEWAVNRARCKVPPPSRLSDSSLSSLEQAVNAAKGPRDAHFDLSTRVAKVLLAFDLYCFAVLEMDSVKSTWTLSRAMCVGRERRIECDAF